MKAPVLGTYSAVTSTLALLVAVGGSSYAAVQLTGRDIKNGTVTTKDVRDRTLTSKDLSPRTVEHLTGPAGPAGPAGPVGPVGPPGPTSPSEVVQLVSTTVTAIGADKVVLDLDLPPGSYLATSKVWGLQQGGGGSHLVCVLASSSASDFGAQNGGPEPGDAATLVNQLAFSSSAPTAVTLMCRGASFALVEKRLTVLEVGTISSSSAPDVP